MKYAVVPQVYTIIALGASMFLWLFLPTIAITPSMEGIPLYSIHPLFTFEFCLLLSTAIIWCIVFLLALSNMHKQTMTLTEIVRQKVLLILLVLATIVAVLSGCVTYSQTIHFEEFGADGLWITPALSPPSLSAIIHGYGILFCEIAWIITVLSRIFTCRRV